MFPENDCKTLVAQQHGIPSNHFSLIMYKEAEV